MKSVLAAAAMSLVISDFANAEETRGKAMMKIEPSAISEADIRSVSPALARFGREAITEDLWTRDALSPRDRSVVTVAMLIARNQPAELKHYNLTHITTLERTVHEPISVTSSDLWTAFNTVMNQN